MHDISDHSQLAGNPRRQPPKSRVEGGRVCGQSAWTEVVMWSRMFQLFPGGALLRSPPKLCFSLGSRSPSQSLGRGSLPDPRRLLWAGRSRRAPAPAHGVPPPALLAGRWHPPSAQSSARSGAERSGAGRGVRDRAKPAAPPMAGFCQGKCHSRPSRRCSPSSLSFLPF